jgi:hypothetical protein
MTLLNIEFIELKELHKELITEFFEVLQDGLDLKWWSQGGFIEDNGTGERITDISFVVEGEWNAEYLLKFAETFMTTLGYKVKTEPEDEDKLMAEGINCHIYLDEDIEDLPCKFCGTTLEAQLIPYAGGESQTFYYCPNCKILKELDYWAPGNNNSDAYEGDPETKPQK